MINESVSLIQQAKETLKMRVKLKLNLWQTLFAEYLPRRWRSDKTNLILDLAASTL
jgi:hypothetical protein